MRRKFMQRVLSAILCAAMVFQGASLDTIAAKATTDAQATQAVVADEESRSSDNGDEAQSEKLDSDDAQSDTTDKSGEPEAESEEVIGLENSNDDSSNEQSTEETTTEEASSSEAVIEETTTEEETETEIEAEIAENYADSDTSEDIEYDFAATFPDKVLRQVIVKRLAEMGDNTMTADSETIKLSQLKRITSIENHISNSESTNQPISDITGIDKLPNLAGIDLSNNELDDRALDIDWGKLTKLYSVYLDGNNLTKAPDLSSNEDLIYFNIRGNLLDDEAVKNIKVPEGCNVSSVSQRSGDLDIAIEENYYAYDGKTPLYVKPTGNRTAFTLKFYVDSEDNEVELDSDKFSYYGYYYNDYTGLEAGEHTIWAKLIKTGSNYEITKKYTFNVINQELASNNTYYVSSSGNDDIVFENLYGYVTEAKPSKIELINEKNNRVYASNTSNVYSYRLQYDPRYTTFKVPINEYMQVASPKLERLTDTMPSGNYKIKVTYDDDNNTTYTYNDIVIVPETTVISNISLGYNYDNTGDYMFLSLSGNDIEPEKINYSFNYNGADYTAAYVSSKVTSDNTVIVKVKKEDKFKINLNESKNVTVNLSGVGDYIIYVPAERTVEISSGIFYMAYNNLKNQFEVGISAILGREGVVTAELWSNLKNVSGAEKLGVASANINPDGIAYFTFVTDDGTTWTPSKSSGQYYVYCTYNGETYKQFEYIDASSSSSSSVRTDYWSASSSFAKGTGTATFNYYEGATYNANDVYESTITGGNLETALAATKVSNYSSTNSNTNTERVRVYQQYDLSSLESGQYTITLTKNGETVSTYQINILPDKFILSYISASWQDDDTITLFLSSPNYSEADTDNYTVTFVDPTGKEVENLSAKVAYGTANYSIALEITGLNREEAYKYYYIKVSHKVLGEAYRKNSDGEYVQYFTSNEKYGYGVREEIAYNIGNFYETDYSNTRAVGTYTIRGQYPLQIRVFKRYDSNALVNFTVEAPNDSDDGYYWSKEEIYDKLPDTDEIYDIIVVDARGYVYKGASTIGYRDMDKEDSDNNGNNNGNNNGGAGNGGTDEDSSTKIKLDEKTAVKFNQNATLNRFYASSDVTLNVTTNYEIENITILKDSAGIFGENIDAKYDGSIVTLSAAIDSEKNKKIESNKNKVDVTFSVTIKDYGTFEQTVTINTVNTKPSLSINAVNIIQNQDNFTTSVVNKKTKEVLKNINVSVKDDDSQISYSGIKDGIITMNCEGVTKTTKYNVKVSSEEWTESISVQGNVKYTEKPTLVIGTGVITNNTKTSKIPVSIKDSSRVPTDCSIEAVKGYDGLQLGFDGTSIVASLDLKDGEALKAGTYKYTFKGSVNGIELSKQFSVKVVNTNTTVQLKGKGNVNLANANEYMTITPTLKNTTASITGLNSVKANITDNKGTLGTDVSEQFDLKLLDDGKIKLTYKEGAALKAKQKYFIKVSFDLDDGTTLDGSIFVTPTFKLTTPKANPNKVTLSKGSTKAASATITTTSKTGSNAIKAVSIDKTAMIKTSSGKVAADQLFDISFTANKNNKGNGTVALTLKDAGKDLKAGKYTVTALVYYEAGTAEEYNTPVKVKFTVTVR